MADSMSNFIECSVEIQNLIMSVMEFCLVLEFILILLRMTGSAHLRRKITVTVLLGLLFWERFYCNVYRNTMQKGWSNRFF